MARPDQACILKWMKVGIPQAQAEKLCVGRTPRGGSDPSNLNTTLMKRSYFPPSKNNSALVPIGRVTSRASFREGSMSKMGGRGWRLRTGYMGTGAVVFPDTDRASKAFLNDLPRPLTASDREGWLVYAKRIGMLPTEAERAWKQMDKPSLRPRLAELKQELDDIFEGTSWWGYSAPHPLQIRTTKGGYRVEPPPTSTAAKHGGYTDLKKPVEGKFAQPLPSFPYHTEAARKIWKKALELIPLYPLENPTQILKRAVSASDANPITDLTPEDEKLLRMAVEFMQNGPAGQGIVKIGGAPGGPFNSSGGRGGSGGVKRRGAP